MVFSPQALSDVTTACWVLVCGGGGAVGGASVVVANHCLSAITKLIKDSVIAVMTTSRERERGVSTLDLLLYLSTLKVNDISIIVKTQGQILYAIINSTRFRIVIGGGAFYQYKEPSTVKKILFSPLCKTFLERA